MAHGPILTHAPEAWIKFFICFWKSASPFKTRFLALQTNPASTRIQNTSNLPSVVHGPPGQPANPLIQQGSCLLYGIMDFRSVVLGWNTCIACVCYKTWLAGDKARPKATQPKPYYYCTVLTLSMTPVPKSALPLGAAILISTEYLARAY